MIRDWAFLMALIGATLALSPHAGAMAAAGLLAFAWLKARVILGGFLHLGRAPGWLSALMLPLGFWFVLIWGLHALSVR